MERYFIVRNLEWDTDGKKIKGLPKEVGVCADEDDVEEWIENECDQEEIEYYIMDWLTDEYEWCIAGCEITEVTEEEYKEWEGLK